MEQKKFVGNGWKNQFGVSVSIKKADIMNLPEDNFGNIRLFVGEKKEKDGKSKATHYVKVDEWKPSAKVADPFGDSIPQFQQVKDSDLPF